MQSQRTTPAAEASASQVPTEALASVEQAFTHEVERLKDECEKEVSKQFDLLDYFERKQNYMDKKVRGLLSFAEHVESFLEQHTFGGGASAPFARTRKGSGKGSGVRDSYAVAANKHPELQAHPLGLHMHRCLNHQLFRHHLFPVTPLHHLILNHPAQRISAQCEARFEQEPSAST